MSLKGSEMSREQYEEIKGNVEARERAQLAEESARKYRRQRTVAIVVAVLLAVLCVVVAIKGDLLTVRYVGSSSSNIYHKPSCEYAKIIYEPYRVYYFSRDAAEADHRHACSFCLP